MTDQPERLNLNSHDIAGDKLQELLTLFPEIRTEGGKIDFERLKLALSETVDEGKERYGMNWPGKADCFKTIQQPSLGTLRPCPEESVNFDKTENLIIEGDNLEVLKLLQKSYLGKVKMIYIDPPYNTGNDFIYPDNYTESLQTYLEYTGQVDAEGKKFGTNTDTDGRFHSKWLNMMYPRLYLARNLLRQDGLIFISIDENESDNLRKICNEIFGEENFRNEVVIKRGAKSVQAQFETWDKLGSGFERIMIYSNNSQYRFNKQLRNLEEARQGTWNNHWRGTNRPTMRYPLLGITPTSGQWRWSKERSLLAVENYQNLLRELNKIEGTITQREIDNYYLMKIDNGEDLDFIRLSTAGKPEHYIPPTETTLLNDVWFDLPSGSSKEVQTLFDKKKVFDNPKPVALVNRILGFSGEQDIILDFFAGSGTTAHAVLDLNQQDGGNRKFVLVQLPEPTEREDYPTITEIAKERVRRVIKKLDEADAGKLDLKDGQKQDRGFRVFKLAESNFKTWNAQGSHDAGALEKQLELHIAHIREDRSPDDIFYELLLKSCYPLTAPVEKLSLAGKQVFNIAGGKFFICLEHAVTLELIRAMAVKKPERVVCLDEGFAGNATSSKLTPYRFLRPKVSPASRRYKGATMSNEIVPQGNDIIFYSTPEGNVKVEVVFQDETFWMTQKQIAELFDVEISTISEHLQGIFASGELQQDSVIRKFRITAADGKNYLTGFYHLDAIIAVGYRVNSRQATQFRIWATNTLREFIVKGFVLDDERLKQGNRFGKDYFDELLERIREIRASERRFYLKITDIYEQCSIDYNRDAEITQTFFKTVQNKLHWAITGKTAAELIAERASASKPNMGLQTWKNAPHGKVMKSDVSVAKNYLAEKEIKELERIVSMYLDYAENQAARQIAMKMTDWVKKLDTFLKFNEYQILDDAGHVSHDGAVKLAEEQYGKFRVIQDRDYENDFEREVKKITDSHKRGKKKA